MEWMLLPLKRYAQFSGRSRRKEYWMFVLFMIIVYAIAMYLDSALGLGGSTTNYADVGDGGAAVGFNSTGGILTLIVWLAVLVPSIAVQIRRLHDTDRSGWWLLIAFTGVGAIVLLVFYCLDGTKGPNRFGPDPKGDTPAELAEKFS